jgi:hypothetical protein
LSDPLAKNSPRALLGSTPNTQRPPTQRPSPAVLLQCLPMALGPEDDFNKRIPKEMPN